MKTITAVLLASAATFGLAGAALAADPILPPPADIYIPEAGGVDWSGFYIGANVGYGWGTVEYDSFAVDDDEYDVDGWLFGVQAGANAQFDSIVVGIEGDIAWSGLSGTDVIDAGPIDYVERDINWIGTVRGRLGFAAENFLIYGTAGVAFADSTATLVDFDGDDYSEDSNVHTGWVAGVGAEVLVTDSMSLKAEYLYHSFGSEEYDYDISSGDTSFDVQTVKVGLNFHF